MRRLKTVRRPPIYPNEPSHLPCSSLTHPAAVLTPSIGVLRWIRAKGTYTVGWKNVSTVDGHRVRGSFVFSVGEPSGEAAAIESDEPLFQSPAEPVVRWLVLLGILVVAGAASFELVVAEPVLRRRGPNDRLRRLWELHSTRLKAAALGLLILASAVQLIMQASAIYEQSILSVLRGPVGTVLAETDWGRLWIWRMGLAAAMAGLTVAQARRYGSGAALNLLSLGIGVGLMATLSLTSHAAATVGTRGPAVANDLLHMAAASVWVGGLAGLLLLAATTVTVLAGPQRRRVLAAVVPRFSVMAGLSVATLVVTGLYGAWAQVTVLEALASPYGVTLRAKIALVIGAPAPWRCQPGVGEAQARCGRSRCPVAPQAGRRGGRPGRPCRTDRRLPDCPRTRAPGGLEGGPRSSGFHRFRGDGRGY